MHAKENARGEAGAKSMDIRADRSPNDPLAQASRGASSDFRNDLARLIDYAVKMRNTANLLMDEHDRLYGANDWSESTRESALDLCGALLSLRDDLPEGGQS